MSEVEVSLHITTLGFTSKSWYSWWSTELTSKIALGLYEDTSTHKAAVWTLHCLLVQTALQRNDTKQSGTNFNSCCPSSWHVEISPGSLKSPSITLPVCLVIPLAALQEDQSGSISSCIQTSSFHRGQNSPSWMSLAHEELNLQGRDGPREVQRQEYVAEEEHWRKEPTWVKVGLWVPTQTVSVLWLILQALRFWRAGFSRAHSGEDPVKG